MVRLYSIQQWLLNAPSLSEKKKKKKMMKNDHLSSGTQTGFDIVEVGGFIDFLWRPCNRLNYLSTRKTVTLMKGRGGERLRERDRERGRGREGEREIDQD